MDPLLPHVNQEPALASPGGQVYEIWIAEPLSAGWLNWFEELQPAPLPAGGTRLSGIFDDQAALHGVLERIRDLNLTLTYLRRLT